MHTRRNVWRLSQPWDDILLWYAKGVRELQTRPITDPTSWTSLAAIHGFDQDLWTALDYLKPNSPLPSDADQARFWKQCQHQTWHFLPWHRGYLSSFEAIMRAAIVKLGGPDDWALPYWNYSDSQDPNARKLPTAFGQARLPDGKANPLLVTRRYGDGTGRIVITPADVALNALRETEFSANGDGGTTGFGGPQTAFQHDGFNNGEIESLPHNNIHVLIGGRQPDGDPQDASIYGLMTMPDTAALDPIFWLHHANIDRLWEVWLSRDSANRNPSDEQWLSGPADRAFAMPNPDGTGRNFTAADVLDTTKLGYIYDDTSDPLEGAVRVATRMTRFGLSPADAANVREIPVAQRKPAELVGANDRSIAIGSEGIQTLVKFDQGVSRKIVDSLRASPSFAAGGGEPDRVFLNLENIRGVNDAAVLDVYVNLPKDAKPEDNPHHLAGAVSLFGVRKATRPDSAHGGNGISQTMEITDIVDRLHLNNALDLDHLDVHIVPRTEIRPGDDISVQRVSVYRQGQ